MAGKGNLIFRVTQKLATKIKVVPAAALPNHENPFLDWTANLFMVSRWQCILLTNSLCLYSIVMPGKGIPNEKVFVKQGLSELREYMALDGTVDLFDTQIAPAMNSVNFCKAGDRRVLGSMNDAIFQAKSDLTEIGYPLSIVNKRLNETPRSILKYQHPRSMFMALGGRSQK